MDRDIFEVYTSEIRRPGYVLQGPMHRRSVLTPIEARPDTARPLTATIRERESHRHVNMERTRPRH
jgi:hypothetical protein